MGRIAPLFEFALHHRTGSSLGAGHNTVKAFCDVHILTRGAEVCNAGKGGSQSDDLRRKAQNEGTRSVP